MCAMMRTKIFCTRTRRSEEKKGEILEKWPHFLLFWGRVLCVEIATNFIFSLPHTTRCFWIFLHNFRVQGNFIRFFLYRKKVLFIWKSNEWKFNWIFEIKVFISSCGCCDFCPICIRKLFYFPIIIDNSKQKEFYLNFLCWDLWGMKILSPLFSFSRWKFQKCKLRWFHLSSEIQENFRISNNFQHICVFELSMMARVWEVLKSFWEVILKFVKRTEETFQINILW